MPTPAASTSRFSVCLPLTLAYEGGWSNHPLDPGKATMRGVTQAVYDDWCSMHGLAKQSVGHISDSELTQIYQWRYWDAARCGSLPVGVDYALFDFAVNSGVRRAVQLLQRVLDIKDDGAMGPMTAAAVAGFCRQYGSATLSDALCNARMTFLRGLPTFSVFGKGWKARVMGAKEGSQVGDIGVADRALKMIRGEVVATAAAPIATPKTFAAAA